MLEITQESLTFRRQCIDEFGGDTLDRMIMRICCESCEFSGETSALIATTGFGFESIAQLRSVVERMVDDPRIDRPCPRCEEPDIELEKVHYFAYSESLECDFIAELDPPGLLADRWLLSCYLLGERLERVSVADERLTAVFRETLLRAAASAAELGQNPGLAKKLIDRSVELFGPCVRDRYLLASIQRDSGDYDEALATLADLVDNPTECQRSMFEMGVTHFTALRQGQDHLIEAFTAFTSVLETDEQHAPSHLYIGNLYLGLGHFQESLTHFKSAILAEPDMMEAHFNAGIALTNLKEHSEALGHFEHAFKISPNDADVAERLGQTLDFLGRSNEAQEMLERAENLKEKDEDIEGTLEDLGLL